MTGRANRSERHSSQRYGDRRAAKKEGRPRMGRPKAAFGASAPCDNAERRARETRQEKRQGPCRRWIEADASSRRGSPPVLADHTACAPAHRNRLVGRGCWAFGVVRRPHSRIRIQVPEARRCRHRPGNPGGTTFDTRSRRAGRRLSEVERLRRNEACAIHGEVRRVSAHEPFGRPLMPHHGPPALPRQLPRVLLETETRSIATCAS
jgi:hypothetical protein